MFAKSGRTTQSASRGGGKTDRDYSGQVGHASGPVKATVTLERLRPAQDGHVAAWAGVSSQDGSSWVQVGVVATGKDWDLRSDAPAGERGVGSSPTLYVESQGADGKVVFQALGPARAGRGYAMAVSVRPNGQWVATIDGRQVATIRVPGAATSFVGVEEHSPSKEKASYDVRFGGPAVPGGHGTGDQTPTKGGFEVRSGAKVEEARLTEYDEADEWMDAVSAADELVPDTGVDAPVVPSQPELAEGLFNHGLWNEALHLRDREGEFRVMPHALGRANEHLPGMEPGAPKEPEKPAEPEPFVVDAEVKRGLKVRDPKDSSVWTVDRLPGDLIDDPYAWPRKKRSTFSLLPESWQKNSKSLKSLGKWTVAAPDPPKEPSPLDPQKLYGGEILRDADGVDWKVAKVLVKRDKGKEVVTSVEVYKPDFSGPKLTHKADELEGWQFVDAAKKKWGGGNMAAGGYAGTSFKKLPATDDSGDVALGERAGGTTGAVWAKAKDGTEYVVKTYGGDENRVATELLGNAIYRTLGVRVPEAGVLMVEKKPAVAARKVEGEVKHWDDPDVELAQGFMADALLANWDVVGLTQDNVLWGPDGPVRVDQGGTLEYRAQGGTKEYGPVPSEVWSMAGPKGQAFGTMLLTPELKRQEAEAIAEKLTPGAIDELVDAAPFKDAKMRERVRENLKARVEWMGKYGRGEVGEPKVAEGAAAASMLATAQAKLELRPEQATALEGLLNGYDLPVNEHLRGVGKLSAATSDVRYVVDHVDSLTSAVRAPEDFYAYAALPKAPKAGATLHERGFLFATTSMAEARRSAGADGAVLRVLVPKGHRAVYVPQVIDQLEGSVPKEPELILGRGVRAKVAYVDDGVATAVVVP